jgi:hypothetical protein
MAALRRFGGTSPDCRGYLYTSRYRILDSHRAPVLRPLPQHELSIPGLLVHASKLPEIRRGAEGASIASAPANKKNAQNAGFPVHGEME